MNRPRISIHHGIIVVLAAVIAGCGTPEERFTRYRERAEEALNKGRTEASLRLLDKAVKHAHAASGGEPSDPRFLETIERRSRISAYRGSLNRALRDADALVEAHTAAFGADADSTLSQFLWRALVTVQRDTPANAIVAYLEALARHEAVYGRDSRNLIEPLVRLGQLSYHVGDYEKAETYLERAYGITRTAEDYSEMEDALAAHIIPLYVAQGRLSDAYEFADNVTFIRRGVRQPGIYLSLTTHAWLGYLHTERGEFDAADAMLSRDIETALDRVRGRDFDSRATILRLSGNLRYTLGNYEDAIRYYRNAYQYSRPRRSTSAVERLEVLLGQIAVHVEMGERDTAVNVLEEIDETAAHLVPEGHPLLNQVPLARARVAWLHGQWAEAASHASEAIQRLDSVLQPEHPALAGAHTVLGGSMMQLGEQERALEHLEQALAIRRTLHPLPHPRVAETLTTLAALHFVRGEVDDARACLEDADALWRELTMEFHPGRARTWTEWARLHEYREEFDRAEAAFREAQRIWNEGVGPFHPEAAETAREYAHFLQERGRTTEAAQMSARAVLMSGQF